MWRLIGLLTVRSAAYTTIFAMLAAIFAQVLPGLPYFTTISSTRSALPSVSSALVPCSPQGLGGLTPGSRPQTLQHHFTPSLFSPPSPLARRCRRRSAITSRTSKSRRRPRDISALVLLPLESLAASLLLVRSAFEWTAIMASRQMRARPSNGRGEGTTRSEEDWGVECTEFSML